MPQTELQVRSGLGLGWDWFETGLRFEKYIPGEGE